MKEKVYISKLYDEYASQNIEPSDKYLKLAKKFSESLEKLSAGLSEEKANQLNEMYELMNEMLEIQCREAFTEGYCLGTNLTLEAIEKDKK